jgi:NCS1 family nucleobase:cation symporter-1
MTTVVILIPGFAAQFGHDVGIAWEHIYSLGWVLGCTISSVMYWSLCQFGGFCQKELTMRFEESYEMQSMFADNQIVHEFGVQAAEIDAMDLSNSKNEPKVFVQN